MSDARCYAADRALSSRAHTCCTAGQLLCRSEWHSNLHLVFLSDSRKNLAVLKVHAIFYSMDLMSTEILEHLLNLGRLYLIYFYGEQIGLSIGGEIGCMISTLVTQIIEFDFPLDLSRCSNRILLHISVDLVQYLYYSLFIGCFKTTIYALFNLVHGKRKVNVGGVSLLMSIAFLVYVIKDSENKSYFPLFNKTDRLRDVLSAPTWLRDIEKDFCQLLPFFDRYSGCKFSYDIRKWR